MSPLSSSSTAWCGELGFVLEPVEHVGELERLGPHAAEADAGGAVLVDNLLAVDVQRVVAGRAPGRAWAPGAA